MESKLKPCPVPWCGGSAAVSNDRGGQTSKDLSRFFVYCTYCHLRGLCSQRVRDGGTEAEAIAKWNERPGDAVIEASQKVADCHRILDSKPDNSAMSEWIELHAACSCLALLLPPREKTNA